MTQDIKFTLYGGAYSGIMDYFRSVNFGPIISPLGAFTNKEGHL